MTQFDPDYDDTDPDADLNDDGPGLVGNLRKQLKEANKAKKAAEERAGLNEAAARRVAFLDAKIPETAQTKFFREHYDGELDPETIRMKAIENGFMEAEDHSGEVADLDLQSQSVAGGDLPNRPGSMDQFEADLEEALRNAPRGTESKVTQEVYQRYNRTLA